LRRNLQDCDDNSDEENCDAETTTCSDGEFLCADDDMCYPMSYWCDGHRDCFDGSDEDSCKSVTLSKRGVWD